MKNKIVSVIVLFVVLAFFMALANDITRESSTKEDGGAAVDGTEYPQEDFYTYGDVEKMLYYLADTEEGRQAIGRLIDPLSKSQTITAAFVRNISQVIEVPEYVYMNELSGMSDDDYVSTGKFQQIYENIVASGIVDGLCRQDVYVYDVTMKQTEDGEVCYVSDTRESYVLDTELSEDYYDTIIDAYVKDGTIFWVNGLGSSEVVLDHVWIETADNDSCTFLYENLEKSYVVSGSGTPGDAVPEIRNEVADITISNQGVSRVSCYDKRRRVHIDEITDSDFWTRDDGIINIGTDFKIYNTYQNVFCEESIAVLVGYQEVELIFDGKDAIAAVVDSKLYSEDIRVIISNDSYTSYDFKKAEITCDTAFKLVYPDEHEAYYGAGEIVSIDCDSFDEETAIRVVPDSDNGRLTINNLTRNDGSPSYAGEFELEIKDDRLHIINVVPLEEYLYSVVSSEMPSSSEPEALKALAICARGYAYAKMNDESFAEYNAHLDDSSLCQMYNNVTETKEAVKAVKDTYGVVPTYEDSVIVPLYFSTSCGVTCTNEEIWGGSAYPYLESNLETINKKKTDLSDEKTFREFMDNNLGYDIIEQDMPYYRWSINYTGEDMTRAINSMLEERISMSSDNIKIQDEDGEFQPASDISGVGDVISVEVTERTVSGVVSKLRIEGTEAVIEVTGQTNIRNLITPVNQDIVRQDGFVVTGWTSLPSPFYYIDKTDDGFTIYGGGFGHGVGMSQNGANVLAEEGYNYKYILRHYYTYIDFDMIYDVPSPEEE